MRLKVAAVAFALLIPALAFAQKTSFDFDKTANFTAMKSYALKDGTKVGDPLVDNRITAAIETELKAKGLTRNDATPDIVVVYHLTLDKQKDITSYSSGMGYGPYAYRWGGGWDTTTVRVNEILVGTLIIDVVDAKNETMAFRGIGVKEVDAQAKAEKRDKTVTTAVQKILKNFPPPAKKK